MKYKLKIRYIVLCTLLLVVWATQLIPAMGKIYAHSVYPVIAYILSSFSRLIPFAIGDLFIALHCGRTPLPCLCPPLSEEKVETHLAE